MFLTTFIVASVLTQIVVAVPEITEVTVCEHKEFTITCPTDQTLFINSVFYGRRDPNICPEETDEFVQCPSKPESQIAVSERCNYLNGCQFQVENSNLGGDPCPGTLKYLEVDYQCRPAETI